MLQSHHPDSTQRRKPNLQPINTNLLKWPFNCSLDLLTPSSLTPNFDSTINPFDCSSINPLDCSLLTPIDCSTLNRINIPSLPPLVDCPSMMTPLDCLSFPFNNFETSSPTSLIQLPLPLTGSLLTPPLSPFPEIISPRLDLPYSTLDSTFNFNLNDSFLLSLNKFSEMSNVSLSTEPFQCVLCKKIMSSKQSLVSHQKCHAMIRHDCPSCSKSFKRLPDLYRHQRSIHKDGKLYECKACLKSFGRIDGFKRHIESCLLQHPMDSTQLDSKSIIET